MQWVYAYNEYKMHKAFNTNYTVMNENMNTVAFQAKATLKGSSYTHS